MASADEQQLDLFAAGDLRVAPAPDAPDLTPGERRRRRQAAAIAGGYHPLSLVSAHGLRLHPDAERASSTAGPMRCGTCRFRFTINTGTARSFPKCLWPDPDAREWPRRTSGESTDVRASWPACTTYEPEER